VAIQVRAGSTVYSPDTLPFTVVASDPDGIDSIAVTFLDSTTSIAIDFRSEVSQSFRWPIPARLQAGRPLTISARATDLKGLEGSRTADVTVISRPVASLFGR
jgi:hypothetical protein